MDYETNLMLCLITICLYWTEKNTATEANMCCCEHVVEGDIIDEKLLPKDQCSQKVDGQCITVDPNRLTPHSCCPNATGERCGDGS